MKCIHLTRGFVAIVSRSDWDKVKKHNWYVHFSRGKGRKKGKPCARATINGKATYMHRHLTGAPKGMHVDHLNSVTLDNRQENMEVVTHLENQKRKKLND